MENKATAKVIAAHIPINKAAATIMSDPIKPVASIPKIKDVGYGDYPKFWYTKNKVDDNGEKVFSNFVIDERLWIEFLKSLGFRWMDRPEGGVFLVLVKDNIVREVERKNVIDSFSGYIQGLPQKVEGKIDKIHLDSAVKKRTDALFSEKNVFSWFDYTPLKLNEDTKEASFFYYKNGYVIVTKNSVDLMPYNTLKNAVWEKSILDRDFVKQEFDNTRPYNEYGDYSKFIFNVSGKEDLKFLHLITLCGYLLHLYKDCAFKAVALTDGNLSEGNEGRTGKTIFGKAIKCIRNYCELNGKNFKTDYVFKYAEATISTEGIFLNDARDDLQIEPLFNDITESVKVEKKMKNPFTIKAKYLITTNKPLNTPDASSRDRVLEFEFANHYSEKHKPEDDFGSWFFGTAWGDSKWADFDNFMMLCIKLYLKNGVAFSGLVNLDKRKLITNTCEDFYYFVEAGNVKPNKAFCLQHLCNEFIIMNPQSGICDLKRPSTRFSGWLKFLTSYHENFKNLKMDWIGRSGENISYIFK